MVEFLDTTLRVGEQTPYVNFLVDEKVENARRLGRIDVETIEAAKAVCADRVAVFYAVSQIHLKAKTNCTPAGAIEIVTEQVRYARSTGISPLPQLATLPTRSTALHCPPRLGASYPQSIRNFPSRWLQQSHRGP